MLMMVWLVKNPDRCGGENMAKINVRSAVVDNRLIDNLVFRE